MVCSSKQKICRNNPDQTLNRIKYLLGGSPLQKSDIEKLEDILINQEKYKKLLKLREIELEDTVKETIPESNKSDLQDPRTIQVGGNTSVVDMKVGKLHNDLKYQTLYSIVHNTPKFINTLNDLECIIYEYKYRKKDITINQWDHVAHLLDKEVCDKNRSIGRTTTLDIRNMMLERLADKIGYQLM